MAPLRMSEVPFSDKQAPNCKRCLAHHWTQLVWHHFYLSSFSFRSKQIMAWRVLSQRMALLAFCFRLMIPTIIHLVGSPQARVCLFPAWFESRELVHIPDRISDNGRTHKAQDDFPIVKCVRLQAVPGSEHQADRGLGVNGEVWWLLSVFSR